MDLILIVETFNRHVMNFSKREIAHTLSLTEMKLPRHDIN